MLIYISDCFLQFLVDTDCRRLNNHTWKTSTLIEIFLNTCTFPDLDRYSKSFNNNDYSHSMASGDELQDIEHQKIRVIKEELYEW